MSPRDVLLCLAGLLFVAGVVLGFKPVSAGEVSCGSVFSPSNSEAKFADMGERIAGTLDGATPGDGPDSNRTACDSAISDGKPLSYGGLGLAVVALIGAFVASPNRVTRPT